MCGRFQPSAQSGEALDRRRLRRPAYRLQRKRRLSHGCRYCRSHYCSSCHLDSEYRIGGVGSLFVPLVRLQTRELTLASFSRFFFFFFLSARLLRLLRLLPLFPPCLSLPLLPSARRTSKSSTSFSFPSESELILLLIFPSRSVPAAATTGPSTSAPNLGIQGYTGHLGFVKPSPPRARRIQSARLIVSFPRFLSSEESTPPRSSATAMDTKLEPPTTSLGESGMLWTR